METKNFQELEDGDFIEVYSTKMDLWLLYQVVTDYGIVTWDENATHYGYELELVKESLEDRILANYPSLGDGRRIVISEEIPSKYWKYNHTAKVLYGGRKRSEEHDELDF